MANALMLNEVQTAIRDALANDAAYKALVVSLLGEDFNYSIDMSEVDRPILPAFIIHKLYSDYALGDSTEFVLQFNLSCMLGDYNVDYYPSIINLEELVKEALKVADQAVCQYSIVRVGTRIRFPDTIARSEDIEAVVSVVYMQETTEFI